MADSEMHAQAFSAARQGDLPALHAALAAPSAPALTATDQGQTLLQAAASAGQAEIVRDLLARGADPAQVDAEQARAHPAVAALLNRSPVEGESQSGPAPSVAAPPIMVPPGPGYFYPAHPPPPGQVPPEFPPAFVGPDGMVLPPPVPHGMPPHPTGAPAPGVWGSLPPPEVARTIPCRFFPHCRYGDQCVFFHPPTMANVPPPPRPEGEEGVPMFYPPPPGFAYPFPPGPPGPGGMYLPPVMGYGAPPPPGPAHGPGPHVAPVPPEAVPFLPAAPVDASAAPAATAAAEHGTPAGSDASPAPSAPQPASGAPTAVKADAAPFKPSMGLVPLPRMGAPMHLPLEGRPAQGYRKPRGLGRSTKRSGPMPPCRFFPLGICNKGDECAFPHILPDGTDVSGRSGAGPHGGPPKRLPRRNNLKDETSSEQGPGQGSKDDGAEPRAGPARNASRHRTRKPTKAAAQPALSSADFPALAGAHEPQPPPAQAEEPKKNFSAIVSASAEKAESEKPEVKEPKAEVKEPKAEVKEAKPEKAAPTPAQTAAEAKQPEQAQEKEDAPKPQEKENEKEEATPAPAPAQPAPASAPAPAAAAAPVASPKKPGTEDEFTLVKARSTKRGSSSYGSWGRARQGPARSLQKNGKPAAMAA